MKIDTHFKALWLQMIQIEIQHLLRNIHWFFVFQDCHVSFHNSFILFWNIINVCTLQKCCWGTFSTLSALHTKSIIMCCTINHSESNFFKISDLLYLHSQESAKRSKVAIVSSFKLSLVFVKMPKVNRSILLIFEDFKKILHLQIEYRCQYYHQKILIPHSYCHIRIFSFLPLFPRFNFLLWLTSIFDLKSWTIANTWNKRLFFIKFLIKISHFNSPEFLLIQGSFLSSLNIKQIHLKFNKSFTITPVF